MGYASLTEAPRARSTGIEAGSLSDYSYQLQAGLHIIKMQSIVFEHP